MPYVNCIRTPSEQGSNTKAKSVQKNFKVFFSFMDLLISGKGSANKCPGVPGAQYFSKTNTTCTAADNTTQEKYTYYSFKPMGTVGGVDLGGIGGTQSGNQGLVMGILESLTQVNPNKMIANVRNASSSKCVKVTAPITIKADGTEVNSSKCEYETHYIDEANAAMIEPCMISGGTNPYRTTNTTCSKVDRNTCKATFDTEGFSNYNGNNDNYNINNSYSYYNNKEDDILADTFYVSFSLATIYLLYLFLKKEKAI